MPLIRRHSTAKLQRLGRPELDADEAHVYEIDLGLEPRRVARSRELLDDLERTRASRFATEDLVRKYVASHAGVRIVLGQYLEIRPDEVRFVHNEYGKPGLDPCHATALRFNLSHSGEKCVVAVAEDRAIGVDIEAIRPLEAWQDIAVRFFSKHETARLRALPELVVGTAFFATWARKEAYIKAIGMGMSMDLAAFDVEVDPRKEARLLFVEDREREPERWSMRDLDFGPGYRGAIAIEGHIGALRVQRFEWAFQP